MPLTEPSTTSQEIDSAKVSIVVTPQDKKSEAIKISGPTFISILPRELLKEVLITLPPDQ